MARKGKEVNELLGIPSDYDVVCRTSKGDVDVAYLRREVRERECPACGGKAHVKGRRWRKVWHVPVRRAPLMLMIEVTRMRCTKCGKTWNERHDIIGEASPHMTVDVEAACVVDVMERMSVAATSRKEGPSPHMVGKALDRAIVGERWMPRTLCIDEFKADTDQGKMAVAVADGDSGLLVDVLPRLRRECIDEWFSSFSPAELAGVRYWCCDMSGAFISAHDRWCPGSILCIDRFHVVKLVTHAFGEVRRRVQKDPSLTAAERKAVRKAWKLFLMRPSELERIDLEYADELAARRATVMSTLDLTEEELRELTQLRPREPRAARAGRLLGLSPELEAAHRLMHLFRDWSDMPWCAEKRDGLARWVALAQRSGIHEMRVAAKTIKRRREGILNGYRFGKTNATAEGLNNSIKVLKRMSYGFRGFERMRRRCLLSLGYMRVISHGMKLNGVKVEAPRL